MARNRVATSRGRSRSDATRRRIVDACAVVIRTEGFGGTTTAAIAAQAGLAEGAIFYHYGSLPDLYAEVLRTSSSERLVAYREALDGIDRPDALLRAALGLFAEDRETGHVAVLAELIAGAASVDGLRPLVQEEVAAWVAFVEGVLGRVLDGTGLADLLPPPRDLAVVVVSLFTGAELLSGLAPELGTADALAGVAERVTPVLAAFTSGDLGGRT
ncbi:MAG: TetR/AcrR family transcriptional regulator [Acidimicrobiales bacterium]